MNETPGGAQRRRRNRRLIWITVISALVLIACLVSQAGAISDALSQSASPSDAVVVGLDGSSVYGSLSGLSARDGSVRWRRQLDIAYTGSLVTDGVVYVAGHAPAQVDGQAVLEALRLSDGKLLWRLAFPATSATPWTVQSMLVTDGLLILTVYISQMYPTAPSTDSSVEFVAVSLSTHAQVWSDGLSNFSQNWGARAVAADADQLYVSTTDGAVRAYRLSDGRLAWTKPIIGSATNGQWVWLLVRGDALLAYDSQSEVIRLRPADGSALWKRTLSLPPTADAPSASISGGIVMCSAGSLSSPSHPVIVDPATGDTLRVYQPLCTGPTPIFSGAYLYMLMYNILTVVRISDGGVIWRAEPKERDLAFYDFASDSGVIFVSAEVQQYSFFNLCARVWKTTIGFCPSQTYIAAFDGATGKRYWRSTDAYDALLGVGRP